MPKRSPGWYPDPNDPEHEFYWDGTEWHGKRKVKSKAAQYPEPIVASGKPNQTAADLVNSWNGSRFRASWNGLSVAVRVAISVAVLGVLVLVAYNMQESPYQKECETTAASEYPPGASFDRFVKACIDTMTTMNGAPPRSLL